ncbi:MAG: NAD-dependent deacetylase [Deltaproteobacteria bacterium]|nr:NAD-dependent deacetylase [Deltaproteobacteria bacterium]
MPPPDQTEGALQARIAQAAEALGEAEAIQIAAGAGMGVDSGLPDFRGTEGFWRAYPPFRKLGLRFEELANPHWFQRDPELAWGFYGHRLALYRQTRPHDGFAVLQRLGAGRSRFVFTSNVDGHFQAAGFDEDEVEEVHGSIRWLQCSAPCGTGIWSAEGFEVEVDVRSFRATGPLPRCHRCGAVARPNILMFGDWSFVADRADRQGQRRSDWLGAVGGRRLVVIEIGAGTAVPTVRWTSERLLAAGATLIRINPREAFGPPGTIELPLDANAAVGAIEQALLGA